MGQVAIDVANVSKSYRIYRHPRDRFLEALWRGRRCYHHDFWALTDVCLKVDAGTTVGIIGVNGSGKSTLLQVIAGVLTPTSGRVWVGGRIASLLELGAGFNPEFSGRENVMMNGTIMGFSPEEMRERLPQITAFAEIGEFIDQPVKTYSSGMFVRLAFASAINVDPDVLLIDEALAVGDVSFQLRCMRKLATFQEAGKTIVFVSHDTNAIKQLCNRVVFIDKGRVVTIGGADEVANEYLSFIAAKEAGSSRSHYNIERGPKVSLDEYTSPAEGATPPAERERALRSSLLRHGTGEGRIMSADVLDAAGSSTAVVAFDEPITIRLQLQFFEEVTNPILGFLLRDRLGVDILGINTWAEGVPLGVCRPGDRLTVEFSTRLPLRPGAYSIAPALAYDHITPKYLDWVDNALVFQLLPPRNGMPVYGVAYLQTDIHVQTALSIESSASSVGLVSLVNDDQG